MPTPTRWYDDTRLIEAGVFPQENPEASANTCPECENGVTTVFHSHLRDWETGEYLDTEEVPCGSCEAGLLFAPADAVALDYEAIDAYHYHLARDFDVDPQAAA